MKQLDISSDQADLLHEHFAGLQSTSSRSYIESGQSTADLALANLDITSYATNRLEERLLEKKGVTQVNVIV